MTASQKLAIVHLAVYSAGDTITRDQALALIAALFKEAPAARINPARLAELLASLEAEQPRRRRRG